MAFDTMVILLTHTEQLFITCDLLFLEWIVFIFLGQLSMYGYYAMCLPDTGWKDEWSTIGQILATIYTCRYSGSSQVCDFAIFVAIWEVCPLWHSTAPLPH